MMTQINKLYHSLRAVVLVAAFLYCGPVCHAQISELTFEEEQSRQCIAIVNALERDNVTGKKLDRNMSVLVFDRYIKSLDPARHLLTQADLNDFQPLKQLMYKYLKTGNLGPAFEIFNLYQSRSQQRFAYILKLARSWQTQLDFAKNETLVIDYEHKPFIPDISGLEPLWKKELKNHIINLKINKTSDEEISETLEKIYSNRLAQLSQTQSRDVFHIFMNAVTMSFDPHSQYFAPRVSEDFDIHMKLSLEGIGAVLENEYEYTKVVRLIPKGPADKSQKLAPGDKIIGVGQGQDGEIKDTIGQRIDDVVKLIRGPKGTFVRLKIIPARKSSVTATISLKRDEVKLEEQSAQKKVVDVTSNGQTYKLGIIEIPNFYIDFDAFHRGDPDYKSTTGDVIKLLKELKTENIDGLIVDLRDNGGGALKEANDLTGLFLKYGPTVQVKTKFRVSRIYDEDPKILYTGPLVVLINRMSASASEIFAGAIKDYHRGIIVGTESFGKGTVQELKPLGDGRLKMTSAKFYRISGKSTQHKGVEPDIWFPQIYRTKDTGESALEGALLWDHIDATRYSAYRSLQPMIKPLDDAYKKRAEKSFGIKYLTQRIQLAESLSEQKTLSLNLTERLKTNTAFNKEELALENDYRKQKGEKPLTTLDDIDPEKEEIKEILTEQAKYIAADFITLSHKTGYKWQ
ncbi:MAG: carboxy terminal-processing peptidase [Desulfobacter postgatei]|uniref:C-terminal processing peptidase n=1 Tax=Desulfobacter postgatei 2ac9 TaxID=879212 RepID=I5B1M2_9BACT|nr:carboxy terminal-processing peptidase [Desulfobacter postgatei]EIM63385.1 C-terminal processing peptidase [Desulfobacter postgatei 2ac9]MDD4273839.1 carboxy terminal-processing peptidase [Desulfobacter postgatei]